MRSNHRLLTADFLKPARLAPIPMHPPLPYTSTAGTASPYGCSLPIQSARAVCTLAGLLLAGAYPSIATIGTRRHRGFPAHRLPPAVRFPRRRRPSPRRHRAPALKFIFSCPRIFGIPAACPVLIFCALKRCHILCIKQC